MTLPLPSEWSLPTSFRSRLGDGPGRQRAMTAEGHLLLILHKPPTPADSDRQGRAFWRDEQGTWRSNSLGDGFQALRRHLAEFADRAEELEKQLQDADTAEEYYALLRAISPLHRTVRNLYATLQQAREMASEDRDLINARDQAGAVERAVELLHGDAKNGLDFTIAHQAEQQARQAYDMAVSAHRLNLLAAAFFPIATLGTVFSMNLSHGLEEWSQPVYFWCVLALGLGFGLVLARVIARKPAPVAKSAVKRTRKRW